MNELVPFAQMRTSTKSIYGFTCWKGSLLLESCKMKRAPWTIYINVYTENSFWREKAKNDIWTYCMSGKASWRIEWTNGMEHWMKKNNGAWEKADPQRNPVVFLFCLPVFFFFAVAPYWNEGSCPICANACTECLFVYPQGILHGGVGTFRVLVKKNVYDCNCSHRQKNA